MAAGAALLVWRTAERRWARPGEQRGLSELLSRAVQALRTTAADRTGDPGADAGQNTLLGS